MDARPGRFLAFVAVVSTVGCLPDFGVFDVGVDGGSGDGDADVDVDADADAEPGGACPSSVPRVLVGISWPYGTASVARFALGAESSAAGCVAPGNGTCRCADLTGRGSLRDNVFAMSWVPPGHVGVGTDEGVALLDEQTDQVLWSIWTNQRAVDVFPLVSPEGETLAAFALWNNTTSYIQGVAAYRVVPGETEPRVTSPSGFPQGVKGLAQSPLDPRRVVALRPDMWAALELDPLEPTTRREVLGPYPDRGLRTIATRTSATWSAVAWAGAGDGAGGGGLSYTLSAAREPWSMSGPLVPAGDCSELDCELVDAVPDPSEVYYFVAICDDRQSGRRMVIRLATFDRSCTVLLDGGTLDDAQVITTVSVAPAE